jgi:2-haloacid dehalogenase
MADGRPTTVVFDLGGVLIDWNPRYLYRKLFADEPAMERFLGEVCTNTWNLEMDRGKAFAVAVEELAAHHPEQRAFIEAFHRRWIEMVDGPIRGTVELLEHLAERRVPLLALSNWSAETFPLVRNDPTYAFLGRFERIFLSGELRLVKPDPAIYRHMLDATGRRSDECLFIDDNPDNVAAAERVGMHAHWFRSRDSLRDDLDRHGLLG